MRLRHPKKGSTEISKLALKFGETLFYRHSIELVFLKVNLRDQNNLNSLEKERIIFFFLYKNEGLANEENKSKK